MPRIHPGRSLLRVSVTAVALLALGSLVPTASAAGPEPGTRPPSTARAAAAPLAAAAEGGLQLAVNERGHISRSIAAVASDTTAGAALTIRKPAGATLRKAYLGIAGTGFTNTPLTEPVTIDGAAVSMDHETPSRIQSYNYFSDITALIAPKVNAAAAGPVSLTVAEPQPDLTDGEVLIAVYDDPSVTVDQTVSVLYGALSPTGDQYGIDLAAPISLADPATRLEMSLGISYSCQETATCGDDEQFSRISVNGAPLTGAAGGEDDGATANGSLITVGGEGDSTANPADPAAAPTGPRSDDELYDLRPFVKNGDTHIAVTTINPSLDDNVFLATFTMNPPVTGISSGTPEAPPNQAPVFTESPAGTVYPSTGDFRVAAKDPDGGPVTISWSPLPQQPARATCTNTQNPSLAALVTCRLTPTSGSSTINRITFTATDSAGATATVTVKAGPAYLLGMGDSYSSGEANPPFDQGSDAKADFLNDNNGACHRSSASWQRLVSADVPYALESHIACSGATSLQMRNGFKGENELDALRALSPKPDVITLTAGGNDVFFPILVGTCYTLGHTPACTAAIGATNAASATFLRGRLTGLYDAIHTASPNSRIVVVGYPNVMGNGLTSTIRCPWISRTNIEGLRATATVLDVMVRNAVNSVAAKDNVTYVSTLDAVRGHELCTGDSWVHAIQINPVTIRNGTHVYSAHPNADGQQAIRRRVAPFLR